ncbi:alpha-1,2-fucosyltransferase [Tumidithrix elongata RA019]|uniref:Alpha-1,2-fucosyltransferase n=1 Tax=Tumidithrix elongata BACA0141 TaxID=2716417 RepID=A0AAW9Q1C4_9CYAN|nr:alpha-1,2-fucosyltransferase [Tumidithrix elongata RA019]
MPVITMSSLGKYGRFGNQIFQYAFLKILARDRQMDVEVPADWIGRYLFACQDPAITRSLPLVEQSSEDFRKERLLNRTLENVNLRGYFQYHTSFYTPYRDFFRSLFQPSPAIAAEMKKAVDTLRSRGNTIVGLHLRRGDYGYSYFFIAPNQWYLDWLDRIWDGLDRPVLFIASDEPEKVVGDFARFNPVTTQDLGVSIPQASFYLDFYLLSCCDLLAISNSSFSFAAAMLNERGTSFMRPSLLADGLIAFNPWDDEPILRDRTVEERIGNFFAPTTSTLSQKSSSQSELSIHFFTVILEPLPFLRFHLEVFRRLDFVWHWHLIDGMDGTSKEFLHDLEQLVDSEPNRITLYQPKGGIWQDALAMHNACLDNLPRECLLWQIDPQEFWTSEQIETAREMFAENPERTAAFYWCWFFVSDRLVITTTYCYGQHPEREWLRTWRFQPQMHFIAVDPPVLVQSLPDGTLQDVGRIAPFLHADTEQQGLVFQRFAFVCPEQLLSLEQRGYLNALAEWENLQRQSESPLLLRDYFSWVTDDASVDLIENYGVEPLIQKDEQTGEWYSLLMPAREERPKLSWLMVPDWTQPTEFEDALMEVLTNVLSHPQSDRIGLVFYAKESDLEVAESILGESFMQLILQAEDSFEREPQVEVISPQTISDWQELLASVKGRILLEGCEDSKAIAEFGLGDLPSCAIATLNFEFHQAIAQMDDRVVSSKLNAP